MSKRKLSKIGECVYCGQIGIITDDHIPPQNLFSKPHPNNLIKVPSCNKCHGENSQVSKDDEYFRLMITLREDVADHSEVQKVLHTVFRSLGKPEKLGFRRAFLNNSSEVDARTKSGIYLGKKVAYDVQLERLDRVVTRITKGLFFHEKGFRLPDKYDIVSYSESGFRNATDEFKEILQKEVIRPLMTKEPKTVGNDVFTYRVGFTEEDPFVSAWLLTFYNRVSFLSLITPQEKPNLEIPTA